MDVLKINDDDDDFNPIILNYFILVKYILEIKDLSCLTFDLFRVWLWPIEITSGQKYFAVQKTIQDFLSNFYLPFHSISYCLWDNWLQTVYGLTFDLLMSAEVKLLFTIRKPIHDFLFNIYWHFTSLSYHYLDIWLQAFQGLTFTFDL